MKSALLCLLLFTAVAAQAADLYKVELIIFENLDPAALQAEAWPTQANVPALDNVMELPGLGAPAAGVAADKTAWRALTPAQLTMGGAYQRLRATRRYRPLLHMGWIQPVDGSDRGAAVHVSTGSADSGTAPQINGSVALRRGRYLHADVDLAYTRKSPVGARLSHSRRLRPNELHYIDHPLFGMIISVTPADAAAKTGGVSRVQ